MYVRSILRTLSGARGSQQTATRPALTRTTGTTEYGEHPSESIRDIIVVNYPG